MSVLEVAIKELKTLPPSKQDEAAKFIHSWESAVNECSKIDYEDW